MTRRPLLLELLVYGLGGAAVGGIFAAFDDRPPGAAIAGGAVTGALVALARAAGSRVEASLVSHGGGTP